MKGRKGEKREEKGKWKVGRKKEGGEGGRGEKGGRREKGGGKREKE